MISQPAIFHHRHFPLLILLVLLITFLAYSNIFHNEFIGDDFDFIARWSTTRSLTGIPKLIAGDLPEVHLGTYRPVRSLFYLAAYQFWGTNPVAYHAFSLGVHLLATLLVILVVDKLTRVRPAGLAAGLLFGLHPIHTEAVTFVSASFDTTSAVFFLASFYFYLVALSPQTRPKNLLASFIFAALAFFTNEQTIVLPALLLAHHLIFAKGKTKSFANFLLPFFGLAGLYLFIRFGLLNITSRGADQLPGFGSTILVGLKALLKYLELLLAPVGLSISHTLWGNISTYTYPELNYQALIAQSLLSPPVLLATAFLIASALFIYRSRRRHPLPVFALAWFFITLLPVLNFFPASLIFAERYAYLPSAGFILLLITTIIILVSTSAVMKGSEPFMVRRRPFNSVLLLLLIATSALYFYQTYRRNQDWHDEITFWQATAATDAGNPTVYYQLAKVYQVRLQLPEAIASYRHTIALYPNFPPVYLNLGMIAEYQGDLDPAVGYYQQALELDSGSATIRRSLATAHTHQADRHAQQNQLKQAAALYAQATSVDPTFVEARLKRQDLCGQFPQVCN